MPRFAFVRHAETVPKTTPALVSLKGVNHAVKSGYLLQQYFSPLRVVEVVGSMMDRSSQTVAIMAEANGIEVTKWSRDPRLTSPSIWDLLYSDNAERDWPKYKQLKAEGKSEFAATRGSCNPEVLQGLKDGLRELIEATTEDTIFGTHCPHIQLVIELALDREVECDVDNCGAIVCNYEPDTKVLRLIDTNIPGLM